ncbi:Regulatory protein BlaR1 [Pseudoalteromonas sp. P1-9]|uniref:M56 family metallopeptidase n=1 Tax=Pseudoalteromonas sp. P1-9 TaxID=1710354 RepID=UPI0006D62A75|nr:M56 family metallopeptidase [Pseudoalteromonas sp. P1-9]KPV98404.1 Regulatory protein BlaR1 [Pseudoalteromonas sp. P1-9]
MMFYLLINISISVLVLSLLAFGNGSNKANYRLSVFALVTWCIPYPMLAKLLPADALVNPIILSHTFSTITAQQTRLNTHFIDYQQLSLMLLLSSVLLGGVIFSTRLIRQLKTHARIVNSASFSYCDTLSKQHAVPVYRAESVPSGMLMGVFNSKVVLSNTITQANQIALIVNHEKTHKVHNDNLRLLILTLVESLLWWNPLVKKLSKQTRFYIEALCDEQCAQHYGYKAYQADFAELILHQHQSQQLTLNCTATSTKNNNIQRLKRLKEQREMTLKNKLTYTMSVTAALLLITWHTLALAAPNSANTKSEQGAFVNFELNVTERTNDQAINTHTSQMTMWVHFNEKAAFNISDKFHFNFMVSENNDVAEVEMDILEVSDAGEEIVAQPKLIVAFDQEAKIEIDNYQVSNHAYSIAFTPSRGQKPE